MSEPTTLLVPGIGNSEPEHWQSRWEAKAGSYRRVQQRDWDNPVCAEWTEALEAAAIQCTANIFIAAHSLGCLAVAHWMTRTACKVHGIFLVAVPDPNGPTFPAQAIGFSPVPTTRFPCPSVIIASANDPYSSLDFAKRCAEGWGSQFINIGHAGHINVASGVGEWSEGQRLLRTLIAESHR